MRNRIRKILLTMFFIFTLSVAIGIVSACGKAVYIIEFIMDGEIYATVQTNGNELINMPQDPVKDGYVFDGWYRNSDLTEDFFTENSLLNEPIFANLRVYAGWTAEDSLEEDSWEEYIVRGSAEEGRFYIPPALKYMQNITFLFDGNFTLTLVAPNGRTEDLTDGENYTFAQKGIYDFIYKQNEKILYSKSVYCGSEIETPPQTDSILSLDFLTDGFFYTACDPYGDGKNYSIRYDEITGEFVRIEGNGIYKNNLQLGAFAITGIPDGRQNDVGFEIRMTDAQGRAVDGIFVDTYYLPPRFVIDGNDGFGAVVVDDIKIDLKDGEYVLTVRAFDRTGVSCAANVPVTVESNPDDDDIISFAAPVIGTEGGVNESVTLKNANGFALRPDHDPARPYMVRKINAGVGSFSLTGSEFTAYTQGSCYFEEGHYIKPTVLKVDNLQKGDYRNIEKAYIFTVNDSSDVVFEKQGTMPAYSAKDTQIHLPSVVAHNRYARAMIRVEIKGPNDAKLSESLIERIDDLSDPNYNGYRFTPTENGRYTVTYMASINGSTVRSETFIIIVGDITAPTFSVAPVPENLKRNDKFVFAKMVVSSESDDIRQSVPEENKWDDIRFTKRLILPDGTIRALPVEWGMAAADRRWTTENEESQGIILLLLGTYKVEYIAADRAGNESKIIQEFIIF